MTDMNNTDVTKNLKWATEDSERDIAIFDAKTLVPKIATRATVSIYEKDTRIETITSTFDEIAAYCKGFKVGLKFARYGEDAVIERIKGEHMGVNVSNFGSLHATERDYANAYLKHMFQQVQKSKYDIREHNYYAVLSRLTWYRRRMDRSNIFDEDEFNRTLDDFMLHDGEYARIHDLNGYAGIPGIYICVVDDYNSCYIGRANDIGKRVRQHWVNNSYFTGHGFDLFNSYDTTRVFAKRVENYEDQCKEEIEAIRALRKFSMNILSGELSYMLENGHGEILNERGSARSIVECMIEQHERNMSIYDMLVSE